MRWCPLLILLSLLLQSPPCAWGQAPLSLPKAPGTPPFRTFDVSWPEPPERNKGEPEHELVALSPPLIPDTDSYPNRAEPMAPVRQWFDDTRFDTTGLPSAGQDGLGIVDVETATTLKYDAILAPLTFMPYAAAHAWNGPTGVALPAQLYDLSVELGWRPRLAEWLFIDLAGTPGLYTDFKHVTGNSFMLRGRAVGIVAFSERLQVAAGVMYVNRNLTKVLPAGGVIWNSTDETRLFLIFPQPRISHRLATFGETHLWGYLGGEFGGGRWEAQRFAGMNESMDYTDWRALGGIETVYRDCWRGHLDVGYVFNRRVNFASTGSNFYPSNTVMVRAGLRF